MRRLAIALLCLSATAGCGSEKVKSHPSLPASEVFPVELPLLPTPVTVTGPTAPGGVTGTVALVGPTLPTPAAVVRLRARIDVGSAAGVTTVTSFHPGEPTGGAVAVPAGTVRLVFLDEAGNATPFSTQVTVPAGGAAQVPVGSIRVAPSSVVHPERAGTQALTYRIGQGTNTLERVRADLNTVVDLPPGTWEWNGVASRGELPAISLTADGRFVDREWGSVYVTKNAADTVSLQSAANVVLYAQTTDRVEYLLPATDQTHGCMIYLGIVNLLTIDTITLCQDAVLHADLRAR